MRNMLNVSNKMVKHIEQFIFYSVAMSLQERINELFEGKPDAKNAHLAKFCGIARATVTDWRNGKTKTIEGSSAYKVAAYFGNIEPQWVQNGTGKKYKPAKIDVDPTHQRVLFAMAMVKKMADEQPEPLTVDEMNRAYRFAMDYALHRVATDDEIEMYITKLMPSLH